MSCQKKVYVTTSIPYVNSRPHVGHALAELSQLRAIFGIFAIIFAAKPCVSIGTL